MSEKLVGTIAWGPQLDHVREGRVLIETIAATAPELLVAYAQDATRTGIALETAVTEAKASSMALRDLEATLDWIHTTLGAPRHAFADRAAQERAAMVGAFKFRGRDSFGNYRSVSVAGDVDLAYLVRYIRDKSGSLGSEPDLLAAVEDSVERLKAGADAAQVVVSGRPKGGWPRVNVDSFSCPVHETRLSGEQIRCLPRGGVSRNDDLFLVVSGGKDRKIYDSTIVDIEPGMRFITAPHVLDPEVSCGSLPRDLPFTGSEHIITFEEGAHWSLRSSPLCAIAGPGCAIATELRRLNIGSKPIAQIFGSYRVSFLDGTLVFQRISKSWIGADFDGEA